MPCDSIIPDKDIGEIYSIKQISKINLLKQPCEGASLKEIKIDLFDKDGTYITYLPIDRKYYKQAKLRAFEGVGKVAKHELFVLNEEHRDKGIAKAIAAQEEVVYRRNGFNEVHIDAAFDGVNVWKKLRYEFVYDSDKHKIFSAWRAYIMQVWPDKEKLNIITKYQKIDDVPKKYMKPRGLPSMGDWLIAKKVLPLIEMYKRIA